MFCANYVMKYIFKCTILLTRHFFFLTYIHIITIDDRYILLNYLAFQYFDYELI